MYKKFFENKQLYFDYSHNTLISNNSSNVQELKLQHRLVYIYKQCA